MNLRYHVVHDERSGYAVVFDAQTSEVRKPTCWQDMLAYHTYLTSRHRHNEAQAILADFMYGGAPITQLGIKIHNGARIAAGF